VSSAEPRKTTEEEKNHKYCGEYGLESAALRNCMDRNGRAMPHDCLEALIDAGEVSRSEVERRKRAVSEITDNRAAKYGVSREQQILREVKEAMVENGGNIPKLP
jgi:hypothetical protein